MSSSSLDRRAFVCASCSLFACGTLPDPGTIPEPTPVDSAPDSTAEPVEYPCGQEIDPSGSGWTPLALADYPELAEVGGWVGLGAVIIAHPIEGCYVAMERACSHEGVLVNYQPASFRFVCPQHGAVYDLQGNKVAGPQPTGLPVYPCGRVGDTIWFNSTMLA